jgi:stearoyl-CoA desaturase (delta-9 desaturase)
MISNSIKKYYEVLQIPIYLIVCIILWPQLSWHWVTVGLLFAYIIMLFSQEIGGHRYFSHHAFKISNYWERLIYFTMIVAANGSPLDWRTNHLDHHQSSDTEKDPTSPKRFGRIGIYSNYWKLKYKPQQTALKSLVWVNRNKVNWLDYHRHYFKYVIVFQLSMILLSTFIGYEFFFVIVIAPVLLSNIFLNTISAFSHRKEYKTSMENHCAINNKFINVLSPGAGMHADHHNIPGIYKSKKFDIAGKLIDLISIKK